MIGLGLDWNGLHAFHTLLNSPHRLYTQVQITNLSHVYLQTVTTKLIDGVVNVDSTGDVTRNLQSTFLDPDSSMHLDSKDPNDGALYMDRMLRVWQTFMNPEGTFWFDVPVFTGPVTKVQRKFAEVSVEAQGKELLCSPNVWRMRTFAKGMRKVDVIYEILVVMCGEAVDKIDIPQRPEKIPGELSITIDKSPWQVAQRLARSMNCQLYYDARGIARLRSLPNHSLYDFNENTNVLTKPQIDYDTENVVNSVIVRGAVPKGSKERIGVRVSAPASHPLSPVALGRNGVPRYLPKVIEDDSITSEAEAREIANAELHMGLIESMTSSFDALPAPHLEPLDLARIVTSEYIGVFRMNQFSIPLTALTPSTIGYLKKITPNRKAIRGNKR